VQDLQRAVVHGPRHAYILSGPDSVGKRTIAREFARALVCTNPPAPGIPCGACSACRRVGRDVHPDVTIADLAKQSAREKATSKNTSLNIETVREVSAAVALRPMEGRWRIAIVDDVETMQETAQEAFLKTLEEPPSYAIIVLLTSDVELLLPTILSRCVVRTLQIVPETEIARALTTAGVANAQAETIALASDGRPGWAFRAANEPALLEERLTLERVALAWADANAFQRLITATKLADQFMKDRDAVFTQILAVQKAWRRRMIDAFHEGARAEGTRFVDALRSIERCLLDLEANVRPRLALQNMVIQWPELA